MHLGSCFVAEGRAAAWREAVKAVQDLSGGGAPCSGAAAGGHSRQAIGKETSALTTPIAVSHVNGGDVPHKAIAEATKRSRRSVARTFSRERRKKTSPRRDRRSQLTILIAFRDQTGQPSERRMSPVAGFIRTFLTVFQTYFSRGQKCTECHCIFSTSFDEKMKHPFIF